jgi:hypothetical protein
MAAVGDRRQTNDLEAGLNRTDGDVRRLWLSVSLWMAAGVALEQCLTSFWDLPPAVFLVCVNSYAGAGAYQHLVGLLAFLLSLGFSAVFVTLLWKLVIRFGRRSDSIGRFCGHRPLLAALAIVAIYAGWQGLLSLTGRLLLGMHSVQFSPVVSHWVFDGRLYAQTIIPVALFLWLARRRMGLQQAV